MNIPNSHQSDNSYLLFQIRDEKNQTVGHIIATNHFTDKKALEAFELNDSLKNVISSAGRVFMEILGDKSNKNLDKTTISDLIIRDFIGIYPPESWTEIQIKEKLSAFKEALRNFLSDEKFKKIESSFENYSNRQQVVFYAQIANLANYVKFDMDKLYDDQLTAKLIEKGKDPEHFESDWVRDQREKDIQKILQQSSLDSLDNEIKIVEDTSIKSRYKIWKHGDVEKLKDFYNEFVPEEHVRSQHIRNQDMVKRIIETCKSDSENLPLFIVGEGHLFDANTNIPSLLENYKIYQVIKGQPSDTPLNIQKSQK